MSQERNPIQCPHCKREFSVTEAIAGEIERDVEQKFQLELKKQADGFQIEKKALQAKIKLELAKEAAVEMTDLKAQVLEKEKKLAEFTKNEIELRQRARALEEREKGQELEIQRKLDAQKNTIEEDVKKRVSEEFERKTSEKDLKIGAMLKQIEDLKRKAEQGSQQTQGEVLELELERTLTNLFPIDSVTAIGKGERGGDVLHVIQSQPGVAVAKILYESKNTKAWRENWIQKAKDDQRAAKAEFMVIVTSVLPKGIEKFGMVEKIWVTDSAHLPAMVTMLRHLAVELNFAQSAATNKGEKLEMLYHYMTQTQFRQRIEAIYEAFQNIKDLHESQKKLMVRNWASQEKCLERVLNNTAGMYGDIQGIIGGTALRIESLEVDGERAPLLESPEA